MDVEVDGVKYLVTALPLELAPYDGLLAQLLQKTAVDFAEAEKISNEIKLLRQKILAATVTPIPEPQHSLQLYQAVIEATKQVMVEAELFRVRLNTSASNHTVSVAAASASK